MNKRRTIEDFIKRAIAVHGNRYDYSKSIYFGCMDKIEVICQKHGPFWQMANSHLQGVGCPQCGWKRISHKNSLSLEDFVKKAKEKHGTKYDYSKSVYLGCEKKMEIICPIHGTFWQEPNNHLRGGGCRSCGYQDHANKTMLGLKAFVERANEIHGGRYDYSEVIYKNSYTKVKIICKKHGAFHQIPHSHFRGRGCPKCSYKNEADVGDILEKHFSDWKISHHKFILIGKRRRTFDYMMEKDGKKVIVEYDGKQHYVPVCFSEDRSRSKMLSDFIKQKKIDRLDYMYCKYHNILLHRIKYNENKEKSIVKLKEKIKVIDKKL